jgi:hypothetical protein
MKVLITYPKEFSKSYFILRSYSDFRALDERIRETFSPLPEGYPELVKMKWFGNMEVRCP